MPRYRPYVFGLDLLEIDIPKPFLNLSVRNIYQYQIKLLESPKSKSIMHSTIAETAIAIHA